MKVPKVDEILQIIAYIKANFKCDAVVNDKKISVTGFRKLEVDEWIKEKLDPFLRDDFPVYWKDSLQ